MSEKSSVLEEWDLYSHNLLYFNTPSWSDIGKSWIFQNSGNYLVFFLKLVNLFG